MHVITEQLKIFKSILQGQLKSNIGTNLPQTIVKVLSLINSSSVYLEQLRKNKAFLVIITFFWCIVIVT